VASFEVAFGLGENVVGGKVDPDKFLLGTSDETGKDWQVLEKVKGTKLIQMVNTEEAIVLLDGNISEEDLRVLAGYAGLALTYDEVGMQVNGILAKHLFGKRYFLSESTDSKQIDKDFKKVSKEIADMVKAGAGVNELRTEISKHFLVLEEGQTGQGLDPSKIDAGIEEIVQIVAEAKTISNEGKEKLGKYFVDRAVKGDALVLAEDFISILKEIWENDIFEIENRDTLLNALKMKVGDKQIEDIIHVIRALIDNSFTANLSTTGAHQTEFCITDEIAMAIARMSWDITSYYKDQRDIEFAIEIDPRAPISERLSMYIRDREGNLLVMDTEGKMTKTGRNVLDLGGAGKTVLSLYNLQARPYTSAHAKVNFVQEGTEVDAKFVKENDLKAIANGTKGENATHAYTIVFDSSKSVAEHAEWIKRLQRGEFTEEEKTEIRALGFDPEKFTSESEERLPLALYLLEADPSHDPIMRLVDAVITIRGGDTCHAAIFCREQGIPAITAVGKVNVDGRSLKTGDGLTVDAPNGKIFKLGTTETTRIPINYVSFRFKPHGVPGFITDSGTTVDEDGFAVTQIGHVIAAKGTAQKKSATMLAPDSNGDALRRAEFIGEEIGVNIFAGYGHGLIEQIKAGKMEAPERNKIIDLHSGNIKDGESFLKKINEDIYAYLSEKAPEVLKNARELFGCKITAGNATLALNIFDNMRDVDSGAVESGKVSITEEGLKAIDTFSETVSQDTQNFLHYVYGVFQRRYNFDYNVIEALEAHPWVLDQVADKLDEKGYSTFAEYAGQEFYYFYNLMGFTISPEQKGKNRAYDFAQDKVRGMVGSEVEGSFAWPGVNPLVGLRGTSLEIEGVDADSEGNQKVLSFLLDAVIDANKHSKNQAWFYVFVRFAREMDMLDIVLERIAKRKEQLPKQIGIMIEVPSNAMMARDLGQKLLKMQKKYKKYGTELVFFSFGTNDYSFLAGKGDREDPRLRLKILDPAALTAVADMVKEGYFYDSAIGVLPLVDEGAEPVRRLMEAVVKEAQELGVDTSLCGEAITAMVSRGDYEGAGKIMSLLSSFGISTMKASLLASMISHDVRSTTKQIAVPEKDRDVLFDFSENGDLVKKDGVVKGEIIFIDKPEDFIADTLKDFAGTTSLETEREFLEMQSMNSARSTMRTWSTKRPGYGTIVVISKNLVTTTVKEFLVNYGITGDTVAKLVNDGYIQLIGDADFVFTNLGESKTKFAKELANSGILGVKQYSNEEIQAILSAWQVTWENTTVGLAKKGIHWDDLQYARAIILDNGVSIEGWDVFERDKGIVPTRVTVTGVKGIAAMRDQLEGRIVTLDYSTGKMYKENLEVVKKEDKLRALPIPLHEPIVDTELAVREDANKAYDMIKFHPLLLLAYAEGDIGESLGKSFDDYYGKVIEQLTGILDQTDERLQTWMMDKFAAEVENIEDTVLRQAILPVVNKVKAHLAGGEIFDITNYDTGEVKAEFFACLKYEIKKRLNGKRVDEFIIDAFKESMIETLEANKGKLVVHATTSLNSAKFHDMMGGFLVEMVNPNPDYGLRGAPRAIGDFWVINRLELTAFKEVWFDAVKYGSERKNFAFQISEMLGTQSGAVALAWAKVLQDTGIIPSDDLRVGLEINTPSDTLSLEKYIEYIGKVGEGLSFFSYSKLVLGAAYAGVDIYWDEWRRLGKEEDMIVYGEKAAKMVKGAVEKANLDDGKTDMTVVTFDPKDSDLTKPAVAPIRKTTGKLLVDIIAQRITPKRGAYTGEVHIDDAITEGATVVMAGHSETRANFVREDDAVVNAQIKAAHARGVETVILCVGETGQEKLDGLSESVIEQQVVEGLKGLTLEQIARTVIAYEPRWAIRGSGYGKPATPQDAQAMAEYIKKLTAETFHETVSEKIDIIYGGAADMTNARGFLVQDDISGLLVGGKATSIKDFIPMVQVGNEIGALKDKPMRLYGNWKTYPIKDAFHPFMKALTRLASEGNVNVAISPSSSKIRLLTEAVDEAQEALEYDDALPKGINGRDIFDSLDRTEAGRKAVIMATNIRSPLSLPGIIQGAKETGSVAVFQLAMSELKYTFPDGEPHENVYRFANMVKEACAEEEFTDFALKGDHITVKVDQAFLEDQEAQDIVAGLFENILSEDDPVEREKMFYSMMNDENLAKLTPNVKNALVAIEKAFNLVKAEVTAGMTIFALDPSFMPTRLNVLATAFLKGFIPEECSVEGEFGEIDGKSNTTVADALEFITGVRYKQNVEKDPKTGLVVDSELVLENGKPVVEYEGKGLLHYGVHIQRLAINNGTFHGNNYDENGELIETKMNLKATASIAKVLAPFGIEIVQHGTTGTPLKNIPALRAAGIRSAHVATHFQNLIWSVLVEAQKEYPEVKQLMDEIIQTLIDKFGEKFGVESRETASKKDLTALIGKQFKTMFGPYKARLAALPQPVLDKITAITKAEAAAHYVAFASFGTAQMVKDAKFTSRRDMGIAAVVPSETTTLGVPTLRVDAVTTGGTEGHFVVPAGTSTGILERPTKGLTKILDGGLVEKMFGVLKKLGVKMDQTIKIGRILLRRDKDNALGAETTLGVQMSTAWAAAKQLGLQPYEYIRNLVPDLASKGVPRTKIQYNITNGGAHANNSLNMQEFMIITHGETTVDENRMCDEIDRKLGELYMGLGLDADPDDNGVGALRGKEGGYKIENLTSEKLKEIYAEQLYFQVQLKTAGFDLDLNDLVNKNVGVHEFVLHCMVAAIKAAGYEAEATGKIGTVGIALDPATSDMVADKSKPNEYDYEGRKIGSEELADIFTSWVDMFPIISIEDGMDEKDWDGWMDLIDKIGDKILLIGDDNLVTQAAQIEHLVDLCKERGWFDETTGKVTKKLGILIKLNQNGFLATGIDNPAEGYQGTLEVIRLAKKYGIEWIISHRSKEAEPEENEVSIAEVAAATDAIYLKSGDHVQGIRAVKEDRYAEIVAREIQKLYDAKQEEAFSDFEIPLTAEAGRGEQSEISGMSDVVVTGTFTTAKDGTTTLVETVILNGDEVDIETLLPTLSVADRGYKVTVVSGIANVTFKEGTSTIVNSKQEAKEFSEGTDF
ncbi:MAG: triose-phosphate isomerase, partial [Candidatus Omnitrophica bacterium]|nr:triose-phosphate isomerase [Candidatus Omnitrophota bacterium]